MEGEDDDFVRFQNGMVVIANDDWVDICVYAHRYLLDDQMEIIPIWISIDVYIYMFLCVHDIDIYCNNVGCSQ